MSHPLFARYRSIRVKRGYRAAEAFKIAKRESDAGNPAPWYGGATYHHSKGNWSKGRRDFYCDNGRAPFRNVQDAEPARGRNRAGYYCDEYGSNICVPQVALISGRGWIAGLAWTDQDGETWFPCEAFEDKKDAARYADSRAESYAEKEREYQDGWQSGQAARNALGEALGDAMASLGAARIMRRAARAALSRALAARSGEAIGILPPDSADECRRLYRQAVESMRDKVESACETRREAWRAWWNAWPGRVTTYENSPYRAGWHDGAAEA